MSNPPNSPGNYTTLKSVKMFSSEQLQSLGKHWIETVEQLLSAAATKEGCKGIELLLDMNQETLGFILSKLAERLPKESRERICKPQAGGYLGVRFDKKDSDKRGEKI